MDSHRVTTVGGVDGGRRGGAADRVAGTGRDDDGHDWMLELMVPEGVAIDDVIQAPALRDFLGDLRLLGASPTVLRMSDPLTLRGPR